PSSNCNYRAETWHYVYLEGIGQQVSLDFIDTCRCGEYHMRLPPPELDALLRVPYRSLTQRHTPTIDEIPLYTRAHHPPLPKFRNLEEVVTAKLRVRQFPFNVRTDFLNITHRTVMLAITIGFDETIGKLPSLDQVKPTPIRVYGRVMTMTGHIAETFE